MFDKYNEEVINLRREFHKIPELGYFEFKTKAKIIDYLKSIRGNFLYKIRYYYRNIELYSFNTKDALINNIEEVACIIERTLDKIIEEEVNK